MALRLQPSDPPGCGFSSNNGVLHFENIQAAGTTTETSDTCPPPLRFNSLNLDELSEELDRRTKETQRLQEEVEYATKVALEKFGIYKPENSSYKYRFNVTQQQAVCGLDSLNQKVSTHGEDMLENSLDDCLQQMSNLQTCDQHQQEMFSFDEAIMNLQTKLQKVQMEKDILSDLRMKDSRKHLDQMEKMLSMLEELQDIKRSGDQKLQETEDETLALNRKVETLEQNIKELYHTLLCHEKKQCGHKTITSPKVATIPTQLSLASNVIEDLREETDELQKRLVLESIEHLGNEQCNGVNKQKERMEQLITSLGQEMAMLTDKLSSSKDSGVSLSVKLELLRKLAEGQASLNQCGLSELESSSHKEKVCFLEQQLIQAQFQLVNVQREKEQSLQQTEELLSQLDQLKRCGEQQQHELREEAKALRGQKEAAREQLHRAQEEKSRLMALLEQRAQERRKSQEEELQRRQREAEQHFSSLEDAQSQCQMLLTERETLRLKLSEKEKMVEILRLQMESSTQTTAQHCRTIDSLHQENSLLSNQLNQHKLEIQQLRAELDQHKTDLAAAEHERRQVQASVMEQPRRVQETLKKLTAQLEVQRVQLLTLSKEHKELQRLHSCKNEEHEGVVLRLQSQLKNAQAELDQVRRTLRTLEGADGHGLQMALGMQKEITARREQIDSLHGRIQHLEETVEKLHQEKHYQNLETQHQLQELAFVREEKRQLANEMEALHSKDKELRDRISKLEAILHKMSESFTDCQDFIQLQEQDFFRLKLKHALDLKELQGRNLDTSPIVTPPVLDSPTPSALAAPPSSHVSHTQMKSKKRQEYPTRELRSLIKELRGVISENHGPHTAGSSFHRRRSAPERAHRTAFNEESEETIAGSRLRRKTCGSDPHFLKTAELKNIKINSSNKCHLTSSPAKSISFAQLHSHGRRSPVHSLLTSDPNS